MNNITQRLFHLVCVKNYSKPADYDESYFERGFANAEKFFMRFGANIDFKGKIALDVGCGYGSTCIYMAQNGAARVVGIDIDSHRITVANSKLLSDFKHLANVVQFRTVEGAQDLNEEKYDVVISQDSFEHINDPEHFIRQIRRNMARNGILAIGFGPLWKTPYGGHIKYMTRLPWAHLVFPEHIIMHERRRFRPDETPEKFDEILGGLNKMTLHRFMSIMENSGFECIFFRANPTERKLAVLFNILRQLPFCKELFTFTVYSVWRLGADPQPPAVRVQSNIG